MPIVTIDVPLRGRLLYIHVSKWDDEMTNFQRKTYSKARDATNYLLYEIRRSASSYFETWVP